MLKYNLTQRRTEMATDVKALTKLLRKWEVEYEEHFLTDHQEILIRTVPTDDEFCNDFVDYYFTPDGKFISMSVE